MMEDDGGWREHMEVERCRAGEAGVDLSARFGKKSPSHIPLLNLDGVSTIVCSACVCVCMYVCVRMCVCV